MELDRKVPLVGATVSNRPRPDGTCPTAQEVFQGLGHPSSDARSPVRSVLVATSKALVTSSDALVPSSILAPSSDALCS